MHTSAKPTSLKKAARKTIYPIEFFKLLDSYAKKPSNSLLKQIGITKSSHRDSDNLELLANTFNRSYIQNRTLDFSVQIRICKAIAYGKFGDE